MENFTKLVKYLKNQIDNRQVKEFKKDGDKFNFTVMGRKYVLDTKKNSITLFIKTKGEERSVDLDLKKEEVSEIVSLLKKPLTSPKADEQGRKPYLKD
jgi:hypothetical protein